jgi:hypothetical protein
MYKLINWLAFLKLPLALGAGGFVLAMGLALPAHADDDGWQERREEFFEELEEQNEEAREEAEDRWEDQTERLEELREDGMIGNPHPLRRYYGAPPRDYLPPPQRYYYEGPPYDENFTGRPREYRGSDRSWERYRLYGTPGAGYREYPGGLRAVQVGPIHVFWHR